MIEEQAAGDRLSLFDPLQQFRLVRVGGIAVDAVNLGADLHVLAGNADTLRPFQNRSSKRSLGLEADEQDRRIAAVEIVNQMVPDTPGLAHAGSGQDDRA